MRQIADKTDGVRQRSQAPRLAQIELTRGGVQRGEKLISGIGTRLDQGIEQGGFAGIGITHQRNREGIATLALLALRLALLFDLGQALLGPFDGVANHSLVQLDLLFTRAAAHASAAGLAFKVGPAPDQTRRDILQPRQFDLQLALMTSGALRKNLKNQ